MSLTSEAECLSAAKTGICMADPSVGPLFLISGCCGLLVLAFVTSLSSLHHPLNTSKFDLNGESAFNLW